MPRLIVPPALLALILLLAPFVLPKVTTAQDAGPDPAAYLPEGTTVVKTASGDVDGDSRDDLVALYALARGGTGVAHAGLLVLQASDDGPRPLHLFGEPPNGLRQEPTLDPNGSTDLALRDLTGDGRPEIVLTVTNTFQEPTPRTALWVFGVGMVPVSGPDDPGPISPPWAGTGFALQAYLEGSAVSILPPPPGSPSPASALRREAAERRLGGPDPTAILSETFYWRNDGFRLGARSLRLPDDAAGAASSPEAAVLSFYAATARGDMQSATGFLTEALRASRSAIVQNDPSAPARNLRVEEVRPAHEYLVGEPPSETDRDVYVRVSMADPRADAPPAEDPNATVPPQGRQTDAGIWRVHKDGDQWRLASGSLHQTADLVAVTDALPPGVTPLETASGDLRGRGVEDVVVLLTPPGRFANVEPWVLFGGAGAADGAGGGFEAGVPLQSFLPGDDSLGSPGGSVAVEDVTGDGAPEITFNGIVGAHAAVLWVLHWDGSTLAPLFDKVSNSPAVGLEDLDHDGVPEVVLGQSGYCGSYAASPRLTFAFRWEGDGYRSASWRYPSLEDGLDEFVRDVLSNPDGDHPTGADARACIQHMLATANAFRGKAAETRTAYRAYAEQRQQLPEDQRRFVRPSYLAAPYVEADLRAVLAAAEGGQFPGWGPAELAVLHDLLGDALSEQANNQQSMANGFAERGRSDQEREARRTASEARQAATHEYEAALALDPTDDEARRAVGD
jgi:hypothetical protein